MLRKFSVLLTAGALSAALGTSAFAEGDAQDGYSSGNRPGVASDSPFKSTIKGQHLGSAMSAQWADRQIELRPGAKYVNVTRGKRC